jgi:hypothetical protein
MYDVNLVPSINLEFDEEGGIEEALACSRADFHAIEHTIHPTE